MRRLTSTLALATVLALSSGVAAQTDAPTTGTNLYHVDLESGELTSLGIIGTGQTVVAFAIDTTGAFPLTGWGITDAGTVLTFNATLPGAVGSELALTGIPDGDWLVGIDQRPATGQLIGLSAWGTVYWIDPATGETWPIGDGIDPTIESELIGFDFNPTVDRIRVDVSTTQNLRLNPETGMVGTNPDTGQPTIDGNLAFAEGDASVGETPEVVGAGYTNSVADASETRLYVIDRATNSLAIQDPPNDGVLNTVAVLDAEITDFTGFDIHPNGDAFLTVPNGD
ncbi:MAG: DUF4394 domain-containing protein [Thermomicrobiales bacterium]|nr:DUF4394 domain-containing protein [Thermomicrobiales bacterium]